VLKIEKSKEPKVKKIKEKEANSETSPIRFKIIALKEALTACILDPQKFISK